MGKREQRKKQIGKNEILPCGTPPPYPPLKLENRRRLDD
jgi:hypothetical protein